MITLPSELQELETAEDFLEHFGIPYDMSVINRSRLHILQRLHDYLSKAEEDPTDDAARDALIRDNLARAYDDFIRSDPLTERVFKVLRDADKPKEAQEPGRIFIPLDSISTLPPQE